MKQYLLLLRSSDFVKSGNTWTSNPINLYSNSQYKNFSYLRSGYGLNLLNDRVYVGTEVTSPAFNGQHATPYSSNVVYKTNVGEVVYEPSTPSVKRFIDTSSRIDVLSFKHTFTNLPGTVVPTFTLIMYESDSATGPWLRSTVSSESNIIFAKNCKPFIKLELEIYSDGSSLDTVGLLFYLEVAIHDPAVPVISTSVRNILKRFPSWTEIFEDSFDPATPALAIPQSTGGKFLNALLQESLDDALDEIDVSSLNAYINSADENTLDWIYVAYNVPPNLNTIFGNGIQLARVSSFARLVDGKSTDYSFYYSPIDRQLITLRKFNTFTVNSVSYTQEPINVFNEFDEFGARLGLPRLYLENNSNYKKRILDINNNLPGVSLDALKRTLRRELDIWRAYGATPNSDYLGATPEILEISDIESSTPFFSYDGNPTDVFRNLIYDLNVKYPSNFGYVNWEAGMWDYAGLKNEGVGRIPAIYDTSEAFGQFYQPGVGDFSDAKVEIQPLEAATVDFSGKIKISGFKALYKTDVYSPVVVDYSWIFEYIATVADYDASKVGVALVYEISLKPHNNYATPSTFYVNINYNNYPNFYVGNRSFQNSLSSPEFSYIPIFDQQGMSIAELEFRDKVYNQRYFNSSRGSSQSAININDAASINVIFGRSWASPSYQAISTGSYKASFSKATPAWSVSPAAGSNMGLSTPSGVISHVDASLLIGSNVYATKQQKFSSDRYNSSLVLNTPNIYGQSGISSAIIKVDDLVKKTVFRHAKATPSYIYIYSDKITKYTTFGSEYVVIDRGGYSLNPYDDETYLVPASPNILFRQFNSQNTLMASPDYFGAATINYSATPNYLQLYTQNSSYYPFKKTEYEYFEAETSADTYSGFVDETNRIFKSQEEYDNSFLLEDKFLETINLNRFSFGLPATPRYLVDSVSFTTDPSSVDVYSYNSQSLVDSLNTAFAADPEQNSWKNTVLKDAVLYLDANNASFNAQIVSNLGTGGSALDAQVGTSALSTGAYIKDGALVLPGVSGNYVRTYDTAAYDISGNIEIVCRVHLVNWHVQTTFVSKYDSASIASYLFAIDGISGGIGRLFFHYGLQSEGGATLRSSGSAGIPMKNNTSYWIKVTRIAATGVTSFYYAEDQDIEPSSWIQIATLSTAASGNLYAGTQSLQLGAFGTTGTGYPLNGKIYRAIVRNGIGGLSVYDADFSKVKDWTLEFNESTANNNVVSLVGTNPINVDPTLLDVEDSGYFYQPSTTSSTNHVSIPSAVGSTTDMTTAFALAVQIRPFETYVDKLLITKRQNGTDSGNIPYQLGFWTATGNVQSLKLTFTLSDGTQILRYGTLPHKIPINTKAWFGVTFSINNVSFQNTTSFYTSLDGVNWTLIESITNANPSSTTATLRSNAAQIGIGGTNVGAAGVEGKYYRAKIWNTNSFSGSPVLDVNFDRIIPNIQTVVVAVRTATQATVGSNQFVVSSATSLAIGQIVSAPGFIAPNTLITSISGTTITINSGTLAAMSGTSVSFFSNIETILAETGQVATFFRHTAGRKLVSMPSKVNGGRSIWIFGADTGAADVFLVPHSNSLNFGVSDSFTVLAVLKPFNNLADQRIVSKYNGTAGYILGKTPSGTYGLTIYDGVNIASSGSAYINGVLSSAIGIRNVAKDQISTFRNASESAIVIDTTTGTLGNSNKLAIGYQEFNSSGYADMELAAVAIWRRALSNNEINEVNSYLINQILPDIDATDLNSLDVDLYANYDEYRTNRYKLGVHTGWLNIENGEEYIYADPESATYNGRFFNLTLNDSPRKGAPIIAKIGSQELRNVVFENFATPGYGTFYNTETVIGNKGNSLYLGYNNIKNISVTDTYTGKNLFNNLSTSSNFITPFSSATPAVSGREYDVTYYVNDAFYVDNDVYNSAIDNFESKIYFSSTPSFNSNYYITYEKSYKNSFIDSQLSLSQADSPLDEGFIFITKDEFEFDHTEAYLSPGYITDSYNDLMYLTIISYDVNGNIKPYQTFYVSGTYFSVDDPYITTNHNGLAKCIIRYSGSVPTTVNSGTIIISGVDGSTPNQYIANNSDTIGYLRSIDFEIIRNKPFDLKVKAIPNKLKVDVNSRSNVVISGQIYWKDKPLNSVVSLKYSKARTLYSLFNSPSYYYVTSNADGSFNLTDNDIVYKTELEQPGIWFVSVEINQTPAEIQSKLSALGEVVDISNITISGDIVYWNEKYDEIYWDLEQKPLPYAFTHSVQSNSQLISTPNFVYAHNNSVDIYINSSTPNWIPPNWVPLNKFEQYQMKLFGSTPNYISTYSNMHPDFGDE